MKFFSILTVAAALAVATTGAALAHGYKIGALEIGHPWTRATPPGATVGGGYLTVQNNGTEADALIGGTLAVSSRVEIHEMAVANGIMTMRPLPAGLEIPAGAKVELKPGSYHVMFLDLKQPLKKGDKIKGTLEFRKAGKVEVEFNVDAIGATGSQDPSEHADHSGH